MKVFNLFRGHYSYNYRMMQIQEIGDHPEKIEIEKRLRAIEFSKLYGIAATLDAYQVSRSTLFAWKKKLRKSGGMVTALAPGSRAPKKRRQRIVNPLIEQSIIDYRKLHPGVGKEAIKPAVDRFCKARGLKTISESTVGRTIKDLKKQGKLFNGRQKLSLMGSTGRLVVRQKKLEKKLRRKGYVPQNPGDLVQIDSITFFLDNIKRYVISAVDLVTGFAFAYGYKKLNSANAKDFFHKFLQVAPFPVKHIQTDNGDEFEKNFRMDIRASPIIHFHNYPRHPQSNGHIERFNRTVEDQHIQWHEDELLSDDLGEFNHNLMEYLIWFNTEKPHRSLNKKTPLRYYIDSLHANNKKSNMLWTLTIPCKMINNMRKYKRQVKNILKKGNLFHESVLAKRCKYLFHFIIILRLMGAFKPLFISDMEVGLGETSGLFNYFALFILVLSFLFLCLFYLKRTRELFFNSKILWVFLFYILLSLFWSQKPFISFVHFISFCLVSFYSYLVYLQFDLKRFLKLLFSVLFFSLGFSLVSVVFFGHFGIQYKWGRLFGWNGIFGHKNHLGNFSALMIILGFHLLKNTKNKREKILVLSGISIGFITLLGSRSISALVIMFLVMFFMVIFNLSRKSMGLAICFLIILIVCGALIGKYVDSNSERLLGNLFGKEGSFSGRTFIWRYVFPYARERLFFGYGFNAFWVEGTRTAENVWSLLNDWRAGNAHNGYLELVLELGLIGLAIFLLIEAAFFLKAIKIYFVDAKSGSFFLYFFLFFLFANIPEARFLNGFNLWWFLLFILFLYMKKEKMDFPKKMVLKKVDD